MQEQRQPGPALEKRRRERLIALTMLGALAFNYPVLGLFSVPQALFGIPVLVLYLFCAWGLVLWLLARTLDGRSDGGGND